MHFVESILFFQISNQKKHSDQLPFFWALDNSRFAEAEATAVLSILVSQFKMPIKEELHFTAETFEERKRRILSARVGLTMTWVFPWMELILMNNVVVSSFHRPVRVPLVFTHRS